MLEVRNISKHFGKTVALDEVFLSIEKGKTLSLAGESGCGKSTLLRIIAGLETAGSGSILLEGNDITSLKPEKRKFGFVFQNLSLFPHLTVEKNILFGVPKKSRSAAKLNELLFMTGMDGLAHRYPHELSGGQQQRAALARALAIGPKLLILDEPFSSLDELLKAKIRNEIFSILKDLKVTTVMVSHQVTDSFLMADHLAIMRKGKVLQTGAPSEIYRHPQSAYVADFFGTSVILNGLPDKNQAKTSFGTLKINNLPVSFRLMIRPENIVISNSSDFNIQGIVKEKSFKGPHDVLIVKAISSDETFSFETERCEHVIGDNIYLKIPEDKVLIIE